MNSIPILRRVSLCDGEQYSLKTKEEMIELRLLGLKQLDISRIRDDPTLKRIAKGSTAQEHIDAARE